MSWSTRSAISTAAFSVKVRARTSSGRARLEEMRWAMRRVRTVVLPVPAPAMMSSGPSPWTTASCWAGERPSRIRSAAVAVSVDMGRPVCRLRPPRRVRSPEYHGATPGQTAVALRWSQDHQEAIMQAFHTRLANIKINRVIGMMACALLGVAASASAQAVIKVSDDVNVKFGMLLQTQADWTQDAATGSYQENLFIRRVRFLVGGQVAPKITFFFETDDPNLGKSVSGTKNISTGFTVQDAYLEWKAADAFALDAGLMFIPLCRNCYQSAATLLPIDYGAYAFLHGGPTKSVVGRDTGFMARGYLAKSRLEYRVGAFQGARDRLSANPLRWAGHLQYAFLDPEAGFFTTGTYLGKKKVLTVGGGFD